MNILCLVIHLVLRYPKSKVSKNDSGKGGAIDKRLKKMTERVLDRVKMIVQSIGINIAVGELSARPHGLPIVTFGDSAISLKSEVLKRNPIPEQMWQKESRHQNYLDYINVPRQSMSTGTDH